jgi:hypothetical protein
MKPSPDWQAGVVVSRGVAWLSHVSNLLVALTGLVYFVMKYLMQPADPFDVVNHPWQPAMQHAHVVTAPLLVFACGVLLYHAVLGIRTPRPRRRSGLSLVAMFVPMVLSAYFLQVSADELWRKVWAWTHLGTSLVWTVATVAHAVPAAVKWWRRQA